MPTSRRIRSLERDVQPPLVVADADVTREEAAGHAECRNQFELRAAAALLSHQHDFRGVEHDDAGLYACRKRAVPDVIVGTRLVRSREPVEQRKLDSSGHACCVCSAATF